MPNFPGGWELILVLLVIVVVFGSKRLPDSARAIGKSMRIFKAETKGLRNDDAHETSTTATVADAPVPPVAADPPVVPVQPEHTPRSQP